MITVKMLKPYYIKTNPKTVRIVLAYQYFSVFIKNEVYQFIPAEATEIRLDRYNKKIENINDRFAFQKGKDIVFLSMIELISLPGFIFHLHAAAKPYFRDKVKLNKKYSSLIDELEMQNLKRLIDKALDNRDYKTLEELRKLLPDHNGYKETTH